MKKHLYSFKTVIVESEAQAIEYKSNYESNGNVEVNTDYIKKAKALLIYKNSKLLGGCILNHKGLQPLRYMELIKSEMDRKSLLEIDRISEDDLMEMCCIFHAKGISAWDRLWFYLMIFKKTAEYAHQWKKKGILGGSVITQIQRLQIKLMPHVLFRANINEKLTLFGHHEGVLMIYYADSAYFFQKALWVLLSDSMSRLLHR
ncbi:MAG: hypothetical protein MUF58_18110 [Arcicella sp.]|jgi:hypothetical protein|nr:hypothetical protein [Arcicella sp.]